MPTTFTPQLTVKRVSAKKMKHVFYQKCCGAERGGTDNLYNGYKKIDLQTSTLSNLGKVEHPCNSEANYRNHIALRSMLFYINWS